MREAHKPILLFEILVFRRLNAVTMLFILLLFFSCCFSSLAHTICVRFVCVYVNGAKSTVQTVYAQPHFFYLRQHPTHTHNTR